MTLALHEQSEKQEKKRFKRKLKEKAIKPYDLSSIKKND